MLALPLGIITAMYNQHFQLDGTPFSIAPDPRYLYMSAQHREALAHLLYGVDAGGGFVLLTGEVGAGKTTVCRCFLQQIGPQCRVAYIFNPRLSAGELLQAICQEFAIALPGEAAPGSANTNTRELVEALNRHLLESHARGEHSLLIIDEAQNLSADVLEQLRLLTNLETNERKLLQIILIGQPELRQQVQQPALEQLAQRIIARYHLGPLSVEDGRAYIVHRLAVAGARSAPIFSEAAMRAVHRASGGVPRKINLVCDRALLAAYARNLAQVDESLVRHASDEIFAAAKVRTTRPLAGVLAVLLLASVAVGGWALWQQTAVSTAPMLAVNKAVAASAVAVAATSSDGKPAATTPTPSHAQAAPHTQAALPALAAPPAKSASPAQSAAPALDAAALAKAAASEETLLPRLAHAWGLASEDAANACAGLVKSGLFCYRLRGGLAQGRELERPFLLKLKGEPAKWIVVRELNAVDAKVEQNGQIASVRLPLLEAASAGEVLSLWRMEPGFRTQLTAGMRGADVDWLARQLAAWSGSDSKSAQAPTGAATGAAMNAAMNAATNAATNGATNAATNAATHAGMDTALVARVRQFQQLQGLDPDGLVGPRTWMKLNAVAGVAEPRLQTLPDLATR